MEKRPLTPQPESFAVWHRLLQNSLASPRGPFMVELFTVESFSIGSRSPDESRPVRPVTRLEAPHASQVERGQGPRTPMDGITLIVMSLTRFET